jgi:SAM-dependent methyltransferase
MTPQERPLDGGAPSPGPADGGTTGRRDQALSFGPAAERYDVNRPTYPPAALTWALGIESRQVVDLGAGTGIMTRVLLALGHRVRPVEPDAEMRERLAATTDEVRPLDGTAERIPLPAGSVDAVVAGQSYHWFDQRLAHPEIARVLRPGGVFAPVWNVRDESVPWVARLTEIVADERDAQGGGPLPHPDFGPEFGQVISKGFEHQVPMTADRLAALVATRSWYLTSPPHRQAEIDAQVRELAAGLPEIFPMPYVTMIFKAVRR